MRRLAWDAPEVNEEWNCDKGRFAFPYAGEGRLTTPLVRDDNGNLVAASWPEALRIAAAGLSVTGAATGVLTGGRVTVEDAAAYASFARGVLGTSDVDFRARVVSAEETAFLAQFVAGAGPMVTSRPPQTYCWSHLIQKTSRPLCSCDCAKRRSPAAPRCIALHPSALPGWPR